MIPVMQLPRAESVIWLGSLSVGLCNLVMMVRRGLHRQMRWLFGYLSVYAGGGVILWLLTPHLSKREYFFAFWSWQFPVLALSMLLVYSFWKAGMPKYSGFYRLCAAVLALIVAGELVVVIFTTRFGAGAAPTPTKWINDWLFLYDRSAMFVVAGLLWAFFGFVSVFRIQVSRTIRDVALGLLFYALVRVSTDSYGYFHGITSGSGQDYVKLLAAFFMQSVWCNAIVRHRIGEQVETAPMLALKASPEDLERQMDAINLALLRLTGSSSVR